ncbi:rac GTPase-activating protein 1-like [Saccoglossus kowalevskii]|uniref:Rac GTPase-activating protein 1-like n=1 Tax=Saccoglossus kowalevskii TaxID=10224 RepID=A0ABM0MNN0_SACKO|nr:PREDICTED: rac GTPase-activating protein 1-like [Saccoglossus kowalevskii]
MKVVELQQKISKLQAERDTYEVTLKHARNQLDVEMKKRQKSEVNKDALDRQLALVRELLGDGNRMSLLNDEERQSLAFLSATNLNTHTPKRLSTVDESADLLSASDVSYDHTEEDLDDTDVSFLRDGRPWHRSSPPKTKKRPSAPPIEYDDQQLKNKKVKRTSKVTTTEADTSIVTRTTVSVPHSGPITATTHIETVRSPPRQRLLSRDSIDSDDYAWSECRPVSTTDLRNTPGTPIGRGRRAHSFCSKTIIKPESCNPCQKRIGFGKIALKCTDCRAVCHPDCKELVPLPCVPTMKTPGTGPKKHGPMSLEQYTPNTSPMVPALVIHCCTEVESRGLSEQGIYRVSGAGGQVKELKEKMLKGKGNPNLYRVNDIHVVCGVLKDFLRSLSEPIVTYKLHADFVKAGQYCDDSDAQTAIYQAVSELPQSNRDTLAYIILHLQRVSESKVCKMPATNLAKVFGPTLIGHDNPEPTPMQMLEDAKKQAKVMEHLLAMPQDFWNAFIDVDTENGIIYNHNTHCTPESKPTPSSMLGPLTTPGNGMTPYRTASASSVASTAGSVSKKISVFSKTPMTPRFGSTKSKNSARPRHFFSSPKLI